MVHLLLCPNLDNFHHTNLFCIAISFGKNMTYHEPSKKVVAKIIEKYAKDGEIGVVFTVCEYCEKRGVKGISHFPFEDLAKKLE